MRAVFITLALLTAAPSHATPVDRAIEGAMAHLAARKGDRVFHAQGVAYHATYRDSSGKDAYPAIVRLSRGGLTRGTRPDFLGVAIKIPIAGVAAQDVLLLSALGDHGIRARVPALRRGFAGAALSSLTTFTHGGLRGPVVSRIDGALTIGADGAPSLEAGRDHTLSLSIPAGADREDWHSLGQVVLHADRPLSAAEASKLTFSITNTAMSLYPTGVLNRLRPAAYHGSQRGRGAN